MRGAKPWILALAAAGGAAAYAVFLRGPPAVTVACKPVERGPVEAIVANTRAGTVRACRRAKIAPAVSGLVAELPVREGSRVKQGDLLLALWNRDLEARLELAVREAAQARARADETCLLAEQAKRERKRVEALHRDGVAPVESLERATADAEAREAACQAAREAARVSEAQVELARAQLEKTYVRAPFAGIVAEVNTEVGEVVTPSPPGIPTPPALDLIEESCLYVQAPLDEVDAPHVRPGLEARITLDAFPNLVFPGRVRRVAPYVLDREKQARTVDVDVEFSSGSAPEGLLPGYTANIEVVTDVHENVLRIPTDALAGEGRVLVYRDGRLAARRIRTGISNWRYTEVLSGLEEGELVVVSLGREGVEAGARARLESPDQALAAEEPEE